MPNGFGPFATIALGGNPELCSKGSKCVRKDGHEGDCWPKDEEAADGEE